jgi:hypothetical protein
MYKGDVLGNWLCCSALSHAYSLDFYGMGQKMEVMWDAIQKKMFYLK